MRKFQVVTLFPEMFEGVFGNSMMWKAQKNEAVELSASAPVIFFSFRKIYPQFFFGLSF